MPSSPPTLRDMILAATAPGPGQQTYEQLAKRAHDRGEAISGAYLNKIALNKVPRPPTAEHLRAISAALGEPFERVRQAAIRQWWPAEIGDGESIEDKVERLTKLTSQLLDEVGSQREAGGERGSA